MLRQLAFKHMQTLRNVSLGFNQSFYANSTSDLIYGTHQIDPDVYKARETNSNKSFDKSTLSRKAVTARANGRDHAEHVHLSNSDNDPNFRAAFCSRLDTNTKYIQDVQVILQQFYESRVASLERYLSFCVMFHAMAKDCHKPWLRAPWDIAKSQSNLRVATTASPIAAESVASGKFAVAAEVLKKLVFKLSRRESNL
jgi:hypothetical protein